MILEAFTPAQLANDSGGPKTPDMLYTADLLRSDFAAADMVELEETDTVLDEGPGHRGPAAVVRMVARRPVA